MRPTLNAIALHVDEKRAKKLRSSKIRFFFVKTIISIVIIVIGYHVKYLKCSFIAP